MVWTGNHNNDASHYGRGKDDEGFEWDMSSLGMMDPNMINPTLCPQTWMTPESQGWSQLLFENGLSGDGRWQMTREVNSPFSIGSNEVDDMVGEDCSANPGPFANQGQWI